jgi:hypothetical protein
MIDSSIASDAATLVWRSMTSAKRKRKPTNPNLRKRGEKIGFSFVLTSAIRGERSYHAGGVTYRTMRHSSGAGSVAESVV